MLAVNLRIKNKQFDNSYDGNSDDLESRVESSKTLSMIDHLFRPGSPSIFLLAIRTTVTQTSSSCVELFDFCG